MRRQLKHINPRSRKTSDDNVSSATRIRTPYRCDEAHGLLKRIDELIGSNDL
jgi:hypothetical protein